MASKSVQKLLKSAFQSVVLGSCIGLGFSGVSTADTLTPNSDDAAADPLNLAASRSPEGEGGGSEQTLDPAELVSAMAVAVKTLNYEGSFVHAQGSHITSMNILHSRDENGELERLHALDGEAREVIRNHSLVTCIWPASQSVVVNKSRQSEVWPRLEVDLASNQRYVFSLGEPDRVAGLATHVVNVTPKDKYRYGYRFWIDQQTHMLLRSMLLEDSRRIVEQVMFTYIEYPDSIDPARFDVSPDKEQISWLEPKKALATSGLPDALAKQVDRIGFEGLPEGYEEVSETYTSMPNVGGPVSHVMLTDGMASVSVYVEYVIGSEQKQSSAGLSTMGAMNAFGLSTDSAFITAVGEVPAATVQAVATAVRVR